MLPVLTGVYISKYPIKVVFKDQIFRLNFYRTFCLSFPHCNKKAFSVSVSVSHSVRSTAWQEASRPAEDEYELKFASGIIIDKECASAETGCFSVVPTLSF